MDKKQAVLDFVSSFPQRNKRNNKIAPLPYADMPSVVRQNPVIEAYQRANSPRTRAWIAANPPELQPRWENLPLAKRQEIALDPPNLSRFRQLPPLNR